MKFSVSLQFLYEDYSINEIAFSIGLYHHEVVCTWTWTIILKFRLYRTAQVYKQSGKIPSLND